MISSSIKSGQIRIFGLIAFALFGTLSIIWYLHENTLFSSLFGIFAALGLGFIIIPESLKPAYLAWMKAAHFLGKILNMLLLTVFYFLVITPTAVFKRMSGEKLIPMEPDKGVKSYWVQREEPLQTKERFKKRF